MDRIAHWPELCITTEVEASSSGADIARLETSQQSFDGGSLFKNRVSQW
jgi:hypothetical protein